MSCSCKQYRISTPIGPMLASSCKDGLHALKFVQLYDKGTIHEDTSVTVQLMDNEDCVPKPISSSIEWLHTYFMKGNKISKVNPPPICETVKAKEGSFEDAIWTTMANEVPLGKTTSYQNLATLAQYPRAARAVGNVMRNNLFPVIFPCHRVIKSDGSLGNYSCGKFLKEWLLQHEQSRKTTR